MSRIYVASSWRSTLQPVHVAFLRDLGHQVYDFRHPGPPSAPHVADGDSGFGWREIDGGWQTWTPARFREALTHPLAAAGFARDKAAMRWADTFVLVLPCGRSAHLEAGWAWGASKRLIVSLPAPGWPASPACPSGPCAHLDDHGCPYTVEPELMYREAELVIGPDELAYKLPRPPPPPPECVCGHSRGTHYSTTKDGRTTLPMGCGRRDCACEAYTPGPR